MASLADGMVVAVETGLISETQCVFPESDVDTQCVFPESGVDMVEQDAQAAFDEICGPVKMEPDDAPSATVAPPASVHATPSATVTPPPSAPLVALPLSATVTLPPSSDPEWLANVM